MNRKVSHALSLVFEALFFCAVSITFFEAVTMAVEEVASTTPRLGYCLPYLLMAFSMVYLFFIVHGLIYPTSQKTYRLNCLVGGGILVALGIFLFIYDLAMVGAKGYKSMVIGGISALFPLDTFLYGIFIILLGIFLIVYGVKWAKTAEDLVFARPESKLYKGLVRYSLGIVYVLVTMFFTADFLFLPWRADRSGNNFMLCLPFYMLMMLPVLELLLYEVWARKLTGLRRAWVTLRIAPVFLALGVIFSVYGAIAAVTNPTLFSQSLVTFFPLDFMASKAIGQILLYIINIVPPLVMVLRYLISKTRKIAKIPQEIKEKIEK